MLPDVMDSLYDCKERYLRSIEILATRINSGNTPVFWDSQRNIDFIHSFLKRKKEVDKITDPRLDQWLEKFNQDPLEAAREFWYQTLMGIDESLREFF
jgi:glyceraldehyde-3-phosphate dehydrogenase (ferredoxin)